MSRDNQRISLIRQHLGARGLDALVVSLPTHVLMLSGYWPVLGASIGVATRDGQIGLVAPEDESAMIALGWADVLRHFPSGSLEMLQATAEAVVAPLTEILRILGLLNARIGVYTRAAMQPASYVSTHFYGQTVSEILSKVAPNCRLTPADNAIDELLLVKTEAEIGRIRTSCSLAARAFLETTPRIKRDHTEIQAAAMFRSMLGDASPFSALRADGFTYCMSGPNAANAFAAFQISTSRRLAAGDLVLTHCNSHVDGFWTDITRTFCVGEPDDRMTRMYDSVFAAREAALSAIRPGVRARDVDAAARNVLASKGFGSAYKHPTGHGVGFAAIDHNARPCIHPKSDDVLTAGMVFNVEPGIYIDGYGGMRHCDMVAVTSSGMELLTPFQNNPRDLIVSC